METNNCGKQVLKPDNAIIEGEPEEGSEWFVNELQYFRDLDKDLVEQCGVWKVSKIVNPRVSEEKEIVVRKEEIDPIDKLPKRVFTFLPILDFESHFGTDAFKIESLLLAGAEVLTPDAMGENEIIDPLIDVRSIGLSANKGIEPMPAADAKLQCPKCPEKLKNKSSLYEHLLFQHGKEKFECPVCGKQFVWEGPLKQHMTAHFEDRPFNCLHCRSAFKSKCALNRHLKNVHTKRPFICSKCSLAFKRNSALTDHKKKHKLLKCHLCVKQFLKEVHLRQHIMSHSVKTFVCSLPRCLKAYRYSSGLALHLAREHNTGPESIASSSRN